jgi:hypothetical protein
MNFVQKITLLGAIALTLSAAAGAQCAECDKAAGKAKKAQMAADCCQADSTSIKGNGFSVKFPDGSNPRTAAVSPALETYRAGHFGVSVVSKDERRGGQKMATWLPSKLATPLAQMSTHEVKIGGYTGYELVGLDKKGVPTQIRYVKTADHDYLVVASGYDTRVNQDFVSSFRLVAPTVAKR